MVRQREKGWAWYGLVGILALVLAASTAQARRFDQMVVFGDSLSDRGNLNGIVNSQPVVWSNGDIWIDHLARMLSVQQANVDNNAFGGALTSGHVQALALGADGDTANDNQIPTFQALGFSEQVNAYVATSPTFDRHRTVFTVWIGGNDLASFIARSQAGDPSLPTPASYIATAVGRVEQSLNRLIGVGATRIIVMKLADLAITPRYRGQNFQTRLLARNLTDQWNAAMDGVIENLERRYPWPRVRFHTFDTQDFVTDMIAGSAFPDTANSLVVLDQNFGRTAQVNTPTANYLWWDGIHPTARAHGFLATEVYQRFFNFNADRWQFLGQVTQVGVEDDIAPGVLGDYLYLTADGQQEGYARRGQVAEYVYATHRQLHWMDGNPSYAKRGAATKISFVAQPGNTLTFRYKFLTKEPVNSIGTDYGFFWWYDVDSRSQSRHDIVNLADTNSNTIRSGASSPYEMETVYRTYTHTFDQAGLYRVGFGVINSANNRNPSALIVDSISFDYGTQRGGPSGATASTVPPTGIEGLQ